MSFKCFVLFQPSHQTFSPNDSFCCLHWRHLFSITMPVPVLCESEFWPLNLQIPSLKHNKLFSDCSYPWWFPGKVSITICLSFLSHFKSPVPIFSPSRHVVLDPYCPTMSCSPFLFELLFCHSSASMQRWCFLINFSHFLSFAGCFPWLIKTRTSDVPAFDIKVIQGGHKEGQSNRHPGYHWGACGYGWGLSCMLTCCEPQWPNCRLILMIVLPLDADSTDQ